MKQKNVFLDAEANAWYGRNREVLEKKLTDPQHDRVQQVLLRAGAAPKKVLEIGCSNGWRLRQMEQRFSCQCSGLEPSEVAVKEAMEAAPNMDIRVGTAEKLPFESGAFDMVIYGFCLTYCDRAELFSIAAEGDRVLADGGLMVVYDFHTDTPYKNRYSHLEGLYAYKMNHAAMFSWNPVYSMVHEELYGTGGEENPEMDNRLGVSILKKDLSSGYPVNR